MIGILLVAPTAIAQQPAPHTDHANQEQQSQGGVPTVDQHLKLLSEKLDLTADQQTKALPILQEMQDSTQKFMQDENMSLDERRDNAKTARYKADRKLRVILTDEQKKKLDQLEEEWHSGMHGE
jgi:Spy/CpxP family protein refolding chaperone